MILALLWSLILAFAVSPEQVRGEDLASWRALDQASEADRPSKLEAFILAFPDSPLAELAWEQRLDVDPSPAPFRRKNRRLVRRLTRRLRAHQAQLDAREPAQAPQLIIDP